MLCVTASNSILENANCEEDLLCVITAELHDELQDEDMLRFPASLIVKKIWLCTFSSSAVYFCQCVYQVECLQCQVPSREGLNEWDMLPIKKLLKKKTKKKQQQQQQHTNNMV